MADFDPAYLDIALDPVREAGLKPAAVWFKAKIQDEVERIARRRLVVDRIMRDCFGSNSPWNTCTQPPFRDEVRSWLNSVHRLFRGLKIEIRMMRYKAITDDTYITMRVTICGRDYASRELIIVSHDVDRVLDRCYARLAAMVGTNLDLV
jgi:hypothetical protein